MAEFEYSVEELCCESGGKKIFGVIYKPVRKGKCPAVIISHGYNSSYSHTLDVAEGLARHGVIAYCYDFCGGSVISKSEGLSTDMSIKTEQADLRAVMDMITALLGEKSGGLYLYGESQGGYVSAITAAEAPEKTAGLFLLYPALCIPDNWQKIGAEMPEEMDFMGMKLSRKFRDELPEYELFGHLSRYEKPVHIFHGDADRLVNLGYSKRAEESFPNARLTVFAGEGHGFSGEARQKMLGMILDDLAANEDGLKIIDYFESGDKAHWLEEIGKSDWRAAGFLISLINGGTFADALGSGKLYLLTEGERLISFATLTEQDSIPDKSIKPWIGFVYTFPEFRGNRYAGRIIARARADAKALGFDTIYLATDHIGLYEKYGFEYKENRADLWGGDNRIYTISAGEKAE